MIRTLLMLVAAGAILSGCAGVDVYTEKKERVDQDLSGNAGYMYGQNPGSSAADRKKERTVINVDIGLYGKEEPDDESTVDTAGERDMSDEAAPYDETSKKETVILKDGTEAEKEDSYIK